MNNSSAPFPQANDIKKLFAIINIAEENHLKDNAILQHQLNVTTDRQVEYYLSACAYLGIIDNRSFTKEGKYLRNLHGLDQKIELARLICSDTICGTIYFRQRMTGKVMEKNDIISIMQQHVSLTQQVYERRAMTVTSWIKWIYENEWEKII